VTPHWADLTADDVDGPVTSRRRTLTDCLRGLPFDEALPIADSALRNGDVTHAALVALTTGLRGPGAMQARAVAEAADGRAQNPFESVLRAIALTVPGLSFEPQVPIELPGTGTAYVDLADRRHGIVAEADSFTWHGSRSALWRDCRRYNRLVLRGWLVLRFAWEDVMFYPDYVRECLLQARDLVTQRAQRRQTRQRAA
jgi:very-short-patch-repair endonuclease